MVTKIWISLKPMHQVLQNFVNKVRLYRYFILTKLTIIF